MHAETPIRPVARSGKILLRRSNPAVDAWDYRSQSDADPTRANGRGTDREERLLRFVDVLRSEHVRAATVANAEAGKTGFRRWRGPGLLVAVAISAIGVTAAFLQAPGPPRVHLDAQPDLTVGVASIPLAVEPAQRSQPDLPPKIAQLQSPVAEVPADRPVHPAPIRADPGPTSLSNPHLSEAMLAEQPVIAATTQPNTLDGLAPRQERDALARPAPTGTSAAVSEAETAKPVLWVYYAQGSSRAEANARSLSARINSNLTGSDFEAQATLPSDAVIKISEERNHVLARMIGKALGVLGYRWKIENTSNSVGSHRNMIEVWLPR